MKRFKLVRISGKGLERNIRRRRKWGRILRRVGDKGMVGVGKIRKRKKSSREEEINRVKVYRESELKIVLWI